MKKTTRLMMLFILVCLLTVACSRIETTESGDIILHDIYGVTLPLPAAVTGGEDSIDGYEFETDMPAEEVIAYLNLNWPLSGTVGFVEMTPSSRGSGSSNGKSNILDVIFNERSKHDNVSSISFGVNYYGVFKNGATDLSLSVKERTTIEADETTHKTIIQIPGQDLGDFQFPTTELDRIPLPIIYHDVDIPWETVPLPEGYVDEDEGSYDNKVKIKVDQPAMEVIQQINETWPAAEFNGVIDINNPTHHFIDEFGDTYSGYSGQFEKDEIIYNTYVLKLEENITGTAEPANVNIIAHWIAPTVDFDALPLPNIDVREERPRSIWLSSPMYSALGMFGTSFITDMSSDSMIAFFNETWTNEGLNGNIDPQPDGRWVSGEPHAMQNYYQGRFNDMDSGVAYLVRVYDIAGEQKTVASITALIMGHADQLGY